MNEISNCKTCIQANKKPETTAAGEYRAWWNNKY